MIRARYAHQDSIRMPLLSRSDLHKWVVERMGGNFLLMGVSGGQLPRLWAKNQSLSSEIHAFIDRVLGVENCSGAYCIGDGMAYSPLFRKHPGFSECQVLLLIEPIGRLGNFVTQLVNSARIGSEFDQEVVKVFFREKQFSPRQELTLAVRFLESGTASLNKHTGTSVIWKSRFMKANEVFPPKDPRIIDQVVKATRSKYGFPIRAPYDERVVVIHIRGGDVFKPAPHRDYGQPPCSFYKKVLSEIRRLEEVVVVSEDYSNPCVNEVLEYCSQVGVSCRLAGKDLHAAVEEISRSRIVVTSNGTFVPAICFLFPRDRTIISFHDSHSPFWPQFTHQWIVEDRKGKYAAAILERNWTNSDEQRALMLNYPLENLSTKRTASVREAPGR